eukprot:CAMPEP_0170521648 /NCGR_PEP_ID=MMETSP0209-20121228/7019_1 /TAXON_ID=665100 ORGANISM="Litonotus pictus, Strain P1" /NCGR_SAMPLE_ID=MMETSP0209 /ASSEMBLY_ACC=CAM_ASM_000301 /LENGTH=835 /DNA_ID=CAMNT_0010808633 /DNA_START=297 /DNA_END=2804 /DNA_ORIENTATION=+
MISGFLNVFVFGGVIIGMLLLSVFNECFGRKNALLYSGTANAFIAIFITFSRTIYQIFIGILLFNTTGMITVQTSLLLTQEIVVNSKRSLFSTIVNLGYIVSIVFFGLILVIFDSWQLSLYLCSIFGVGLLLLVHFYILESSKTFLKRRQYDLFLLNLLEVSVINNRKKKFIRFVFKNGEHYFLDKYEDDHYPYRTKIRSLMDEEDVKYLKQLKTEIENTKELSIQLNYNNAQYNEQTLLSVMSQHQRDKKAQEKLSMSNNAHTNKPHMNRKGSKDHKEYKEHKEHKAEQGKADEAKVNRKKPEANKNFQEQGSSSNSYDINSNDLNNIQKNIILDNSKDMKHNLRENEENLSSNINNHIGTNHNNNNSIIINTNSNRQKDGQAATKKTLNINFAELRAYFNNTFQCDMPEEEEEEEENPTPEKSEEESSGDEDSDVTRTDVKQDSNGSNNENISRMKSGLDSINIERENSGAIEEVDNDNDNPNYNNEIDVNRDDADKEMKREMIDIVDKDNKEKGASSNSNNNKMNEESLPVEVTSKPEDSRNTNSNSNSSSNNNNNNNDQNNSDNKKSKDKLNKETKKAKDKAKEKEKEKDPNDPNTMKNSTDTLKNKSNIKSINSLPKQEDLSSRTYSPLDLLQFKSQRLKFLKMSAIWFIICGVYFGNTVNIKNLPGSIVVNSIINAFVECFAMMTSGYLMNHPYFGRKKSLLFESLITLIGYSLLGFLPLGNIMKIAISFTNKFVLGAGLNCLFVLAGESYPNTIKNFGYAFNTACGKIGALVLTFVLELLTEFQVNFLFAVLALIAFQLLLTIRETRGRPLVAEIPELVAMEKEKEVV